MESLVIVVIVGTLGVLVLVFIWALNKLAPSGGLFGTLSGALPAPAKGPRLRHNFTLDEMRALDETIEEVERRSGRSMRSAEIREVVEFMLTHPEVTDPGPNGWHHDVWNTFRGHLGVRWY